MVLPGIQSVAEVVTVPLPQNLNLAVANLSTATIENPAADLAPPPVHLSSDSMEVKEGKATTTTPVTEIGNVGAR